MSKHVTKSQYCNKKLNELTKSPKPLYSDHRWSWPNLDTTIIRSFKQELRMKTRFSYLHASKKWTWVLDSRMQKPNKCNPILCAPQINLVSISSNLPTNALQILCNEGNETRKELQRQTTQPLLSEFADDSQLFILNSFLSAQKVSGNSKTDNIFDAWVSSQL